MIDFLKSIKGTKNLIFVFTFIASILFFSTVVNANEQKKEEALWKLGDFLHTMIICREEKDILEENTLEYNNLILKIILQFFVNYNIVFY